MDKEEIYKLFTNELPIDQTKKDESMKKHTCFKIGGNADIYVAAKTVEEMKDIIQIAKQQKLPIKILGNGSNVLVSDNGIRGIVLKIANEDLKIEKDKENAIITVGAGMPLGKLAQILSKNEISNFEFAAGIPGTVGGAIRMNAGAYGREMKDCIESVTYLDLDGNMKTISNEECHFSYRHSLFFEEKFIIVEANLKLPYGNQEEIKGKMQEYAQSRKEKQPLEFPSAGSTFKRGADFITAKLIDECGLKGYKIGGAQVSDKHAGFIVNTGDATAKDVLNLIEYVKKIVQEKTGKKIELEIELLGEF